MGVKIVGMQHWHWWWVMHAVVSFEEWRRGVKTAGEIYVSVAVSVNKHVGNSMHLS
jgi:hypothetical protein